MRPEDRWADVQAQWAAIGEGDVRRREKRARILRTLGAEAAWAEVPETAGEAAGGQLSLIDGV